MLPIPFQVVKRLSLKIGPILWFRRESSLKDRLIHRSQGSHRHRIKSQEFVA